LTPNSIIHFQVPINGLLHGARVDETPSARGSIVTQYNPSQDFTRANYSEYYAPSCAPAPPRNGVLSEIGRCRLYR